MSPKLLADGLIVNYSSSILRITNESVTKVSKGEKSQGRIHSGPKAVDFTVRELLMVTFDPGGVSSRANTILSLIHKADAELRLIRDSATSTFEASVQTRLKIKNVKGLVLKRRLEMVDLIKMTRKDQDPDTALDIAIEAIDIIDVDVGHILEQGKLLIIKVDTGINSRTITFISPLSFKSVVEKLALNLVFENVPWPCVAKSVCRFVPSSVDAYLTPFIKRYLSRCLSKFYDAGRQAKVYIRSVPLAILVYPFEILIRQPFREGYAVWMNVGSINAMMSLLGAGIMSLNLDRHSYNSGGYLPKALLLHDHPFPTTLDPSKLKYQRPLKYLCRSSFLKKEAQDKRSNLVMHISHGEVVAGYRNELDKGGTCLLHETGACNCCLNVIFQPPWHQRNFQNKFLQGSLFKPTHVKGVSCVVYALFDSYTILSTTFMNSCRDDVIPTSLRAALRTLYPDQAYSEEVEKEYLVDALKFHHLSRILESELNRMQHYMFYLQPNIEFILGKGYNENGTLKFCDGLMGEMGSMILELEMELFNKYIGGIFQ